MVCLFQILFFHKEASLCLVRTTKTTIFGGMS